MLIFISCNKIIFLVLKVWSRGRDIDLLPTFNEVVGGGTGFNMAISLSVCGNLVSAR